MNEKVKQHLIQYALKHGYSEEEINLEEILREEGTQVHSEIVSSHRWYDDEEIIVELDGMYIRYYDYHITGDNSAYDMGLEFDESSVVQVFKKQ